MRQALIPSRLPIVLEKKIHVECKDCMDHAALTVKSYAPVVSNAGIYVPACPPPAPRPSDQYMGIVRLMHMEFVEPSKRYADIIVPEGGYNRIAIDFIATKLKTLLD